MEPTRHPAATAVMVVTVARSPQVASQQSRAVPAATVGPADRSATVAPAAMVVLQLILLQVRRPREALAATAVPVGPVEQVMATAALEATVELQPGVWQPAAPEEPAALATAAAATAVLAVLAVMPLATLPPAVQVEAEVLLQAAGMQDRMGQTAPPPLPSDKV